MSYKVLLRVINFKLVLIFGISLFAHSQQIPLNSFYFEFISNDSRRTPMIYTVADTALHRIFLNVNGNSISIPRSPIMLGVKLNAHLDDFILSELPMLSKKYSSYTLLNNTEVTIVGMGITEKNIQNFRYRVVENDSLELIPWSAIPKLTDDYGAKKSYGLIGSYTAADKQLLVEVASIENYHIREGILFNWGVSMKPVLADIEVSTATDYFRLNSVRQNHGYATRFERNGLPADFKFPLDSVEKIRVNFKPHPTSPYAIYLVKNLATGYPDTVRLRWWEQSNYIDIEKFHLQETGYYNLLIETIGSEKFGDKQVLSIPFEIYPSPLFRRAISVKILLSLVASILTLLGIVFWVYHRQNQIKMRRSTQEKEMAGLALKSVRSQLNPHFLSNALTSVQNLISKNQNEQANHYLAKFAMLTRRVLRATDHELISLEDELKILDDYLQMEHLRFDFQYEIKCENINHANIEVPAMLLQPFVENAVKHGVAEKRKCGAISILIIKQDRDLIFTIDDNGNGFNPDDVQGESSVGLKISSERVKLLNELHKNQPVKIEINSGVSGTTVKVTMLNRVE